MVALAMLRVARIAGITWLLVGCDGAGLWPHSQRVGLRVPWGVALRRMLLLSLGIGRIGLPRLGRIGLRLSIPRRITLLRMPVALLRVTRGWMLPGSLLWVALVRMPVALLRVARGWIGPRMNLSLGIARSGGSRLRRLGIGPVVGIVHITFAPPAGPWPSREIHK